MQTANLSNQISHWAIPLLAAFVLLTPFGALVGLA